MAYALQVFPLNTVGRDFVVGDIHGCFSLLESLLGAIGFDERRDRLLSVGDLMDRGPESERAIEFLDYDWFYAIAGNHERMLIDAVQEGGRAEDLWRTNGGEWFDTLHSAARRQIVERVVELSYAFEVELTRSRLAVLVHADMPDYDWPTVRKRLVQHAPPRDLIDTLQWERDRASEVLHRHRGGKPEAAVAVDGVDLVLFGHTPMPRAIACGNTRWLDTGAFMGQSLTVAHLAVDGEVWSMPAKARKPRRGWTVVD